jgi:hypothetical protein
MASSPNIIRFHQRIFLAATLLDAEFVLKDILVCKDVQAIPVSPERVILAEPSGTHSHFAVSIATIPACYSFVSIGVLDWPRPGGCPTPTTDIT